MPPTLRTQLRGTSDRNQSLQDILKTCMESIRVVRVIENPDLLYNTALVTILKNGKKRIHQYNRLDLAVILNGIVIQAREINAVIQELNTKHSCDFTLDDVEIVGSDLVVKADSLGYIGRHSLNGPEPVPTNRVHIIPDLFYGYWKEGTLINPITWQLEIDRVLQDVIFTTDNPGVYIENWLSKTYPMDYSSRWLEEGGVEGPELRKGSPGRADFRLTPSENPLPIIEEYALVEMYDASNNPTFNIDEDGIITFSLMGPPEPPLPELNDLVLRVSGGLNGEDVYIQNMYLFGADGVDDLTISAEVDWGDGSPKETYVGYDIYDIYRYFEPWEQYYVSIKFNKTVPMFHISGDAIVEVASFGQTPITNLRFDYARNLVKLPEYLPLYMTSLERMFEDCGNLNCPNISKWDVSHVTNFTSTFRDAYSFNQPLNDWDMSSAVTLDSMFYNANSFDQPLNKWNISNVKSLKLTFGQTYLFNQNINDWDTSNVENMWGLFYQASNFNQPLDNWDTSKVTNMHGTFQETQAFNQPIGMWDVSKVTDMAWMFYQAQVFNQDLSQWCVPSPWWPESFDAQASAWTLPRPVWGTCPVKPNEMHFTTLAGSVDYVGNQGDQILLSDGTTVDVPVTDETFTFDVPAGKHKVKLVESIDRSNFVSVGGGALVELHNFPVLSTVTKFNFSTHEYNDAPNLTKIPEFFPSNIIDIEDLFNSTANFNQDISMWDVSNVKIFDYALSAIPLFNQPLNSWNVSNATSMKGLFSGAATFNQPLDSWDVSNVTNMAHMFNDAASFNQDISMWDTSNVTDMTGMFSEAFVFNQDISGWDTSNVTDMYIMFYRASAFNQPIGSWDVSNVASMQSMFDAAASFNQDLSQWCVSKLSWQQTNFDRGATNWSLPRPVWGTCPRGENLV